RYHWKILPKIVQWLGGGLGKVLGTSYAESVNAAANIFVGQTEAPLVIRPYIKGLSRSGLFAVMVGGLSTVAGSVLVGYSLLGAAPGDRGATTVRARRTSRTTMRTRSGSAPTATSPTAPPAVRPTG